MIIDGQKIKKEILNDLKKQVAKLDFRPVFCDVIVGNDPVSLQYVNMKEKNAKSVGIDFHQAKFDENISTIELVEEIKKINKMPNMCGLIVQLPLPKHIDQDQALDAIDERIDVDCLSQKSQKNFYSGASVLAFPTALACLRILDSLGVELSNKKIVMAGQGILVGRPVSYLLKSRGYDVATISSETKNKNELIASADILITAIGHGNYIKGDMIKRGAIVIDAGTSESNSGIVGDVNLPSVLPVASVVSPTPGGVGPVTVAMLLSNVFHVAEKLKTK